VLTPAGRVVLPSEEAAQHEVHHGGGLVGTLSQRLHQLLQVAVDVLLQKASGILHRRPDDVPESLQGPRDTGSRLSGAGAPAQPQEGKPAPSQRPLLRGCWRGGGSTAQAEEARALGATEVWE